MIKFLTVLALTLWTQSTYAQVVVDNTTFTLTSGKNALRQVVVKNTSKTQPLVVRFSAQEVENMDQENEERVSTKDILVVPPFLQLAPGAMRPVKMIYKGKESEKDSFYRVKVIPEKLATSPSEDKEPHQREKMTQNISFLTGTGILLTVLPQDPVEDIQIERLEDKVVFTNNSNTFVMFRPHTCDLRRCRHRAAPRIHPGETWSSPIPAGMEFENIRFEKRFAGKITNIEVPYSYE